jgi:uncharacterized protein
MTETTSLRPAVLVTGASSGIGRALALEATKDATDIVLIARSEAPMQALASEIISKGCRPHVLPLDITRDGAGTEIASFLAARDLYADVLINNAGYGLLGQAAQLDAADQVRMIDLNCRALTDLTLQFMPSMMERGRGGILNVGSAAGFLPGPGMAVYYATKAFVRSLSEALWEEARRANVTVSCLAPGPVETAFFERAGVGNARLFNTMRQMNVVTCAQIGWQGFRRGKRMIVPGFQNKIATTVVPFIPRRLLLYAVRRLQKARSAV